jgi:hypothetical protein
VLKGGGQARRIHSTEGEEILISASVPRILQWEILPPNMQKFPRYAIFLGVNAKTGWRAREGSVQ